MRLYKILDRMDFSRAIFRFLSDSADEDIVLQADLNADSLVWDVGGFNGQWAENIFNRYGCHIWIFEPNPKMLKPLNKKFAGNEKVKIFPVALGDSNKRLKFFIRGAGSSSLEETFDERDPGIEVEQQDAWQIFTEHGCPEVSLLKVNIEGGEYELMPYLIRKGITDHCRYIRIQFHEWLPGSYKGRNQIVNALKKHHTVEWCYKFVWESWVKA